jgi:hypothetical protein
MIQPNVRQRRPDLYENDPEPCPRCLAWMETTANEYDLQNGIQEMIQPVPRLAPALARDGFGPCCPDCQAADTVHQRYNREPEPRNFDEFVGAANTTFRPVPYTQHCEEEMRGPNRSTSMTWPMCRVAVGNDRRDQLRAPGLPMGLVFLGLMPASRAGDIDLHRDWLEKHGLLPMEEDDE